MIVIWNKDGILTVELSDGSTKTIVPGTNEIPKAEFEGVTGLHNSLKRHIDAGNLVLKGEFTSKEVATKIPLFTKQGKAVKETVEILDKDGKGTGNFKEVDKMKAGKALDVTATKGKTFKALSAEEKAEAIKGCNNTIQLNEWKKEASESTRVEILNRIEEIQNPKEED